MISTILALVFVVDDLVGFQVRIGYGDKTSNSWCNYTVAGPPFRNLTCNDDTCNGTVHTCTNNCPDGDPASGVTKACYIGDVWIADENTVLPSEVFLGLANKSIPCQARTTPCGSEDCFPLINENGVLTNACGYSCPAPFSKRGSNGPNGSVCELVDCLDRASAMYIVSVASASVIKVPPGSEEEAIIHPFFVAKIGDTKVFQSSVFPNISQAAIINRNFTLTSDPGYFTIEMFNWDRSNDAIVPAGSVTVQSTDIGPEMSNYTLKLGSDDAATIRLVRLNNANRCGAVGWCRVNQTNSRACAFQVCDERVSDRKARLPCGPDCYQQVNYRGALVDICRTTCSEKYVGDNATGTCKVDTSIVEDTGEAALKKKTDQELIIAFAVVLPITLVVGIIIAVIVFCVLYQINKKKSVKASQRIGY